MLAFLSLLFTPRYLVSRVLTSTVCARWLSIPAGTPGNDLSVSSSSVNTSAPNSCPKSSRKRVLDQQDFRILQSKINVHTQRSRGTVHQSLEVTLVICIFIRCTSYRSHLRKIIITPGTAQSTKLM